MTQEQAKQKALDIFNKMYKYSFCPEYADERDLELEKGVFTKEEEWEDYCAKQCALIDIENQIQVCCFILQELSLTEARSCSITKKLLEELLQVKQEIDKL
jgi:hypothetical protein